ncbi:1-deoxy-D-xylulose-5-phosphate synthase, partial [Methylobacterium goesingense]
DHNTPDAMYAEAGLDAAGILKTVKAALPERKARGAKLVSVAQK